MTETQAHEIVVLLTEIRDFLRPTDEPPEYDTNGRCLHPPEHRVDMGRGEWICRRCRHQSQE